MENTNIEKTIEEIIKLNRECRIIPVEDNLSIKVSCYKKKKRWFLDTDIYAYSSFDYSEKGMESIKKLVESVGETKLEQQTKRVVVLSFVDDSKEGIKHTFMLWINILMEVLSTPENLVPIVIGVSHL